MEWVKGTIGMNCFWLISSCSSFFCFCLPLLFAFILSLSLLYLSLCVCLIASLFPSLYLWFLSSYLSVFPSVSSFLYFVFCSHDAVCLFLCIFQYSLFEYLASFRFFKVMLSCGIRIFYSGPTNNTFAKIVLIIFNILTFSLFELLSVWHGYSAQRTSLQFSRPNSSNDFIEFGCCLWGVVLFRNKN